MAADEISIHGRALNGADNRLKRILIVGLGSIGKRHLRIVRQSLPNANIMVLRHRDSQQIPAMANQVTSSIEDVLEFMPQVAVIANPSPSHLAIAHVLLELECHLLIEKPISNKSHGVAEFLGRMQEKGLVCQVGYNLRYSPSLIKFRNLISEGLVGKPFSVRCEVGQYLPDWRPEADYRVSVSARSELGGGVLPELSHELDYLIWIFGEISWVNAWVGNVSELDVDVEDTAHLIIGFNRGSRPVVASLNMDFVRRDPVRMCTVIGGQGSLRWNGMTGCIDYFDPRVSIWKQIEALEYNRDDSYQAQWDHFLSCVETGNQPLVDGFAGLRVLRAIDMVRRSIRRAHRYTQYDALKARSG